MPGIVLSRSISTRALAPDVDRALTAAVDGPADPFARTAITLLRRAGLRLGECLDLELDAVVDYNQLSATRYASNWVYDPVTEVDTTEVLRISLQSDQSFRSNPISRFGGFRSPAREAVSALT